MHTLSAPAGADAPRHARLFRPLRPGLGIAGLAMTLLLGAVGPASAHDYKIGAIEIAHPWSRATPPGAKVGGGYLTLTNDGDTPDRLVAATITAAGRVEIHEMKVSDGVMTMRPVDGGLELPAHTSVNLGPGGVHLMLLDLKQPLVKDTKVPGTLTFEKAGTVTVDFAVDAIGASGKTMTHDAGTHDAQGEKPGMKMDP